MAVEFVFQPGGANELTLGVDEIVRHNARKVHTGLAIFRATLAYNRDLEPYAQRQDRLNVKIDGSVEWCGFLVDVQHDERQATTQIKADGIAKRLEETRPDYSSIGGPVTYSNIALEDAIDDYWGRTPFSASVTPQTTSVIATGTTLQSANTTSEWNSVTPSIPSDTPIRVNNDQVELLQSAFTQDDNLFTDVGGATGFTNADDSNNGTYYLFQSVGDFLEFEFTNDYEIPESELAFQMRATAESAGGEVTFKCELDGQEFDSRRTVTDPYDWEFFSTFVGTSDQNISTGTHTIRIEVTALGSSSDEARVDVICPYDSRYSYTFDNTLNANEGYLDGPELYPDAEELALNDVLASYNITDAEVQSTWTDTTGNQAIAISNNGGNTYISNSNTSNPTVSFSDPGRTGKVRFTFSRYGTRTGETPLTGFNGQAVQDYTLLVDLNDLVVIDGLELTQDHFSNLQTLHDYGDFLWVIEHGDSSIANLTVNSFQRGEETRSKPTGFDDQTNQQPEVQAGSYFNQIYLEGALRDDGTRPTAEVEDSTAISNDGRAISPGVLRDPNITTDGGAQFKANALLNEALQNNNLVGSVTTVPIMAHPGYARPVDFGNGEKNKTVEEIRYTESTNNVEAVFDFTVREGLSEEISQLKRNARAQSNQI